MQVAYLRSDNNFWSLGKTRRTFPKRYKNGTKFPIQPLHHLQMKTAFTLATLAAIATAAKTFGVLVSSSGTVLHLSPIGIQNSQVITPGGDEPELELNDKQQLVNKKTGKYIVVENNILVESSEAGTLWTLENGNLTPTAGALVACQEGDYYLLGAERQCSGGKIDVHLTTVDVKDVDGSQDGDHKEGDQGAQNQGQQNNNGTVVVEECHVCQENQNQGQKGGDHPNVEPFENGAASVKVGIAAMAAGVAMLL